MKKIWDGRAFVYAVEEGDVVVPAEPQGPPPAAGPGAEVLAGQLDSQAAALELEAAGLVTNISQANVQAENYAKRAEELERKRQELARGARLARLEAAELRKPAAEQPAFEESEEGFLDPLANGAILFVEDAKEVPAHLLALAAASGMQIRSKAELALMTPPAPEVAAPPAPIAAVGLGAALGLGIAPAPSTGVSLVPPNHEAPGPEAEPAAAAAPDPGGQAAAEPSAPADAPPQDAEKA